MDTPPDIDRLIQEVLTALGYAGDPAEIARRVRRLNYGLPAEDEFSVICAWLGKCQILHKLDQQQVPLASRDSLQVPDLLASFERGGPCLIEVKVATKPKLSFKPDYHMRLTRYAALLGLPLLIAWKFHSVWALFEARHLKCARVNFNISFGEAMRQNLLGVLVGDLAFKLVDGSGVHIEMAKEALLAAEATDDGSSETWQMRVSSVYFTAGRGVVRDDLHAESKQLFSALSLDERQTHNDTHVLISFETQGEFEFAHRALVGLLHWENSSVGPDRWRALLRAPVITKTVERFSTALDRALSEGLVSHILHQHPAELPDFLAKPSSGRAFSSGPPAP